MIFNRHDKLEGAPIKARSALTPEGRERQLIALAVDLAEKQLREGTASSQVIAHFLKLGSTKAQIEKELLEKQRDCVIGAALLLLNLSRSLRSDLALFCLLSVVAILPGLRSRA